MAEAGEPQGGRIACVACAMKRRSSCGLWKNSQLLIHKVARNTEAADIELKGLSGCLSPNTSRHRNRNTGIHPLLPPADAKRPGLHGVAGLGVCNGLNNAASSSTKGIRSYRSEIILSGVAATRGLIPRRLLTCRYALMLC